MGVQRVGHTKKTAKTCMSSFGFAERSEISSSASGKTKTGQEQQRQITERYLSLHLTHDHVRPHVDEGLGCLETYPGVASGDDNNLGTHMRKRREKNQTIVQVLCQMRIRAVGEGGAIYGGPVQRNHPLENVLFAVFYWEYLSLRPGRNNFPNSRFSKTDQGAAAEATQKVNLVFAYCWKDLVEIHLSLHTRWFSIEKSAAGSCFRRKKIQSEKTF